MHLEFTKMHGLGNDFILIEDLDESLEIAPEAVQWFCDRNFGIGADGLILIRPSSTDEADYFMLYYNSDGSTAEMCGNGIRCFAKYLVDKGILDADADSVRVETLGGIKPITFTRDEEGLLSLATVDMGAPIFDPAKIPTTCDCDQVLECPIQTEYGTFEVSAVSMGNPHAIIWVDDVDETPVEKLGPVIEAHEFFPAKTNVEFAQDMGDAHIRLRVWERGVGETLACGTGACATAVIATMSCAAGRDATIELPGGELSIRFHEDGHVYMTGPATEVFTGLMPLAEDDEDGDQ